LADPKTCRETCEIGKLTYVNMNGWQALRFDHVHLKIKDRHADEEVIGLDSPVPKTYTNRSGLWATSATLDFRRGTKLRVSVPQDTDLNDRLATCSEFQGLFSAYFISRGNGVQLNPTARTFDGRADEGGSGGLNRTTRQASTLQRIHRATLSL
jgi:hypothetical protein